MKVNTIEPEQRVRYEGIVNNSVDQITSVKGKNWLVLGHPLPRIAARVDFLRCPHPLHQKLIAR